MSQVIEIKGYEFTLCQFIGTLVDHQAISHTEVYGGGGSQVGVRVNSNTYTERDIFLINEQGKERSFNFTSIPTPSMRVGHKIQVVWLIPKGKERGPYVFIRNISIDSNAFHQEKIAEIMKTKKLRNIRIILWLCFLVCMLGLEYGKEYSYLALAGWLSFFIWIIVLIFSFFVRFSAIKAYKKELLKYTIKQ